MLSPMDFVSTHTTRALLEKTTKYLIKKPEPINPIITHKSRSILILGNGFDLNLGLKTSYEDFVKSNYWPFDKSSYYEEFSLPYFLNNCLGRVDTWYDLEEALAKFASQDNDHLENYKIEKNKAFLKKLIEKLREYLQNQEDAFVEMMSTNTHARTTPSSYVLMLFLQKEIRSIYTFNYTNLYRIANRLISGFDDTYVHVHGSLEKDNIILGTGDQRNLNDGYFDFHKSASPHYESNKLVVDLNSADEVYIFGHSLGLNDHDYFSDFFKRVSQSINSPFYPKKIKIRIFTFNNHSEMEIKKQLMQLTDNHLTGLYAHCDLKILKTSDEYRSEWMLKNSML